ncbi:MAG: SDR family NAD(P)-dependent oxidoreductase [Desulfobacula sp.]|uniref:SDR family NAD(P)-dependent oxidoreductase n=1 Tax=Desulfobacula sp. TaxID=2593537 RepID=UPI0025BEAD29|nr:SDR family NAD(P)-dependent oxidoreductase [Desulfobacula sp.]MCD4720150.1 SDR family NAD(P)-dependent oxidoreductase [Desulfobacula sp.]
MESIAFENRVAIVTGAGEGIGREYALDLAKRGASVVVNDIGRHPEQGRTADLVVEEIKKAGGQAVASFDSVATMTGGQHIVDTAMDHFGKVDILISNAGILRDRTFMKMTEQEWDDVIGVHLKGAFCVTQPTIKIMKENQYGRIVFTASSSGMYGNFGQSNYGAAKMGVIGIMNTLKLETARYNIKINTVAPNASTAMTHGVFPDEVAKRIKPAFNTPIVTFLCSEENRESGMIFSMSAGWFARSAMVSGKGCCIGDTKRLIKAEEIRDKFDQIKSLENALPYEDCGKIYSLGRPLTGR